MTSHVRPPGAPLINDTYAFVGILDTVNVSLLPADFFYTFDGSVACTRQRR